MQFLTYLILKFLIFYFQMYSQLPKRCLNHLKIFARNDLFLCWIFIICYIMVQGSLAKISSLGLLGNSGPEIMIQLHSTDVSTSKSTNISITSENELILNISIFFFYYFSISNKTARWFLLFKLNYYIWQNEILVGSYGSGCWIPDIQLFEARIRTHYFYNSIYAGMYMQYH